MKIVIDIPEEEYELCKKYKGHLGDHGMISNAIANSKPLSTLTDTEQRLFLSAINRERKVCESIDEDKVLSGDAIMLVPLCQNIERKVKEVLF